MEGILALIHSPLPITSPLFSVTSEKMFWDTMREMQRAVINLLKFCESKGERYIPENKRAT